MGSKFFFPIALLVIFSVVNHPHHMVASAKSEAKSAKDVPSIILAGHTDLVSGVAFSPTVNE